MPFLPRHVDHVQVPPIKCQGIKTKLVPFILSSITWEPGAGGRWIEPFAGSCVVALNVRAPRALLTDSNKHIIRFYQAVQSGEVTPGSLATYLALESERLLRLGESHYYKVRERFNAEASPFDFLFLNRSCFNGVMRFNRRGLFNVPFCRKPQRFSKAYVTKIVNQVARLAEQLRQSDWTFEVADWRETLSRSTPDDFVYVDPPYVGRHTDYFSTWDEDQAKELASRSLKLDCGFAASMWLENRYRRNPHVEQDWAGLEVRTFEHFYHVGSTESLRNSMDEALIIKNGSAAALVSQPPEVSSLLPFPELSVMGSVAE